MGDDVYTAPDDGDLQGADPLVVAADVENPRCPRWTTSLPPLLIADASTSMCLSVQTRAISRSVDHVISRLFAVASAFVGTVRRRRPSGRLLPMSAVAPRTPSSRPLVWGARTPSRRSSRRPARPRRSTPSVGLGRAGRLGGFDLVLVRSPWDYFDRLERFLRWAEDVGAVTRIVKPARVIRWNSHKGYLADMGLRPECRYCRRLIPQGAPDAEGRLDGRLGDVVIKPAVDGGARETLRARRSAAAAREHTERLAASGDVVVQPYAAGIEAGGDLPVFFGGEFSHAVRKVPSQGRLPGPGAARRAEGRHEPTSLELEGPRSRHVLRPRTADLRARRPGGSRRRTTLMELERSSRRDLVLRAGRGRRHGAPHRSGRGCRVPRRAAGCRAHGGGGRWRATVAARTRSGAPAVRGVAYLSGRASTCGRRGRASGPCRRGRRAQAAERLETLVDGRHLLLGEDRLHPGELAAELAHRHLVPRRRRHERVTGTPGATRSTFLRSWLAAWAAGVGALADEHDAGPAQGAVDEGRAGDVLGPGAACAVDGDRLLVEEPAAAQTPRAAPAAPGWPSSVPVGRASAMRLSTSVAASRARDDRKRAYFQWPTSTPMPTPTTSDEEGQQHPPRDRGVEPCAPR